MKITCIADLHGYKPVLPGGDILLICGDITASEKMVEWGQFFHWLKKQDYDEKILIGGNHDNFLSQCLSTEESKLFIEDYALQDEIPSDDFTYLCNSGINYKGLNIWGTPYTSRFEGINPLCCAFTEENDDDLKKHWDKIPLNTDILMTHSPPYSILDKTASNKKAGSKTLLDKVKEVKPSFHVFGHIHECCGKSHNEFGISFYNASCVNEYYKLKKNFVSFDSLDS